jgi:N-acetylglucosaminyl-diphospho-decaprenol L-rhamnosyltransferase
LISIVVVNWNSGLLLRSCVQSLIENAGESEIIVVDNASTDSSLAFAEDIHSDNLLILRNNRNAGFAAGSNLGWSRSSGKKILFLNPDTECLQGSLACLEQTLDSDSSIWAAGGHLLSPSGDPQPGFNVRNFPSIGSVAAEMLFIDEMLLPINRIAGRAASGTAAVDVDQPAAACLMVARTALEAVGGFDEDFYPAWFEDVDLCRRIRNSGGRIQYQPQARFIHHGGYSLGHLPRQDFLEIFHANQIRYFSKHHGPQAAARAKRLIVIGLTIRSALSFIRSPFPGATRTAAATIFWRAAHRIRNLREVRR